MSAEVLQQVAAMFNRFVHIKSGDGTCGTGGHIIRPCEYYCRAVVNFCQTGCYDADDTFVPFLIIKHDGTAFGQSLPDWPDNIVLASSVMLLSRSFRVSLY